ncbi:MAG: TrkH family potassium uptake protein, partial [Myxococcales bacterium]
RVQLRVGRAWLGISAPALLVMSFLLLIAVGTAGLLLIPGLQSGPPLRFLDALFTITSAVCVTGLAVVDTATHFTRLGQLWLLLFIQLGGLGLLALTTLVIGSLGGRLSLRSEMMVGAPVDFEDRRPVVTLALAIVRYTVVAEGLGAIALFLLWLPRFDLADAAWHAVFQAISAFCNAGFATFSDSLEGFAQSPFSLLVLAALVVSGGLGFLSTEEFVRWWRERRHRRVRLSIHTWAAFTVTAALLLAGFAAYLFSEWDGALAGLPPAHRVSNALFMSVTARTAGFNTVPYALLTNSGVLFTILLMLVGGSPGSTAGGLKTTTLAVLVSLAWARFSGRRHTVLHGRTVPAGTVQRTVSVVLLVTAILLAAVFVLGILESRHLPLEQSRQAFLPLVFEVVSAFCTVGLSMGMTADLSAAGRLLAILLMFIGRVGPLVFFAAISIERSSANEVREAAEDLVVG